MNEASPINASASSALRTGFVAALGAYTIWGLFPIFLRALSDASAPEILSHRIVWAVPFGMLILTLRKQWPEVRAALTNPRVLRVLFLTGAVIALNWLIYVWAVGNGRILEASLGYYINPLMYVAAGVYILGESLRRMQIIAVALATIGVLVLMIGGGVFPWVSFVLAISFTAYGYFRKTANVGAMPGLFIEVLLLSPLATVYLIWLAQSGGLAFLHGNSDLDLLLVLAGPVTVTPLVLFAIAARRLTLTTLGFIQYIGPTLQFMLGLYYGETFTLYHAICFTMIWLALGVFSADAIRQNRRAVQIGAGAIAQNKPEGASR
ncbi:MAG: EamA family transporter RarD [Pseudomonadota bacterium]